MGPVRSDRSLVALILGFAVLAAIMVGVAWFAAQEASATRLVQHTLEVENRVSRVYVELLEAEGAQRGFILSGRSDFLPSYEAAEAALEPELSALSRATADNPHQAANVAQLRATVETRARLLRENLAMARAGTSVPAERLERGRILMDDARRTVEAMRGEEDRLLAIRTASQAQQALLARLTFLIAAIAVVALGAFVVVNSRRRLAEAVTARDSLADANRRLEAEAASREAAEAQVRQVQKMQAIGQLTGGIAHDFNNMLAIVIGSLDLAKRRLDKDRDRAEACIDNALDGAHRATQLTSRLLAFSRQQPLQPRVLDVNKLVGGMSELLRRTIGENVAVETVLSGGLWRAAVDPTQLENAIVNLCVNARDAMPDGGKLTIETNNSHLDDHYAATRADVAPGQYVMISVTDTGVGMPAEVVDRAFEPFYTTKGVGRGTGLGLSQVHGFVKQSRGHLAIYSEPGVGTTVKIYLPRNTGELDAPDAQRPTGELPHARPDEIVLVAEDDERVRHLSVDALRELGYTVVQAADAAQALAVLALQPRVDLLFTDVVMPDLDGRRLADRAREARPDLKVLYTTGYTRNAIVHNGMLDAEVAFLAKPFTIDQLALKVRQVLDA